MVKSNIPWRISTICDLYSNSRFDIRDVIIPAMAGDAPIPNLDSIPSDPTFEKIIEQTIFGSHREKSWAVISRKFALNMITSLLTVHLAQYRNRQCNFYRRSCSGTCRWREFFRSGLEIMLDYMDEISEEDYARFSVFRNNYNGANKKINTYIETALGSHERISPRLLKSRIRTDQAIVQSQVACLPLYYYQKSAMALVDYGKLARELEEIISSEAA